MFDAAVLCPPMAAVEALSTASNPAQSAAFPLVLGPWQWFITRPCDFVVVIHGGVSLDDTSLACPADYLHEVLLAPQQRADFLHLIGQTGLVVCKNLRTQHPTYRDVRGRSSRGRLSQGEYYHHDGCSSPEKPQVVEIRCPYQDYPRAIATAVAPFVAVVRAMLDVLPSTIYLPIDTAQARSRILADDIDESSLEVGLLDHVQGSINRAIRRELSAEDARAYFRSVDQAAQAYVVPWEMGESRLIANARSTQTMQHRRAYQEVHRGGVANGHLVKRWPAEELMAPGDPLDPAIAALLQCEGDEEKCHRSDRL